MAQEHISIAWLITWLIQFIFVGLIGIVMFWVKRYIASADKKFDILFGKIDEMTKSFNMQDKLITLFEDRIKRLEAEVDKNERNVTTLTHRMDTCRNYNNGEGNFKQI